MQIVIDISKEVYKNIQRRSTAIQIDGDTLENAVLNGTPLPKGHGDLKDISKLHHIRIRGITDYAYGYNKRTAEVERDIADLLTIIGADKEVE